MEWFIYIPIILFRKAHRHISNNAGSTPTDRKWIASGLRSVSFKELFIGQRLFTKKSGGISIREAIFKVVDEKDLEFVNGLQNLGVNRNVAMLIAFLNCVESVTTRDIEMATDLRQPEVSTAMRTLREMGWISERDDVRSPGVGGRPMKIYTLRATIEEIVKHYEAEKTQESVQTIQAIQRLKELSPAL